jgi:hypothetical protein
MRGLSVALALLLLTGCHDPIKERIVEGPAPIHRIIYRDSRVVVLATIPWQDLVRPSLFDGFRPGMTFKDAEREIGPPDRQGKGIWGPYYEYRRTGGSVFISYEEVGSGTTGAKYASWRLYAIPRDPSIAHTLMPLLRERLELADSRRTEIVIMSPEGGGPSVEIILKGTKVASIDWLSGQ